MPGESQNFTRREPQLVMHRSHLAVERPRLARRSMWRRVPLLTFVAAAWFWTACDRPTPTMPQGPQETRIVDSLEDLARIELKFNEELSVRLSPSGELRSARGVDVTAIERTFQRLRVRDIKPLISIPPSVWAQLVIEATAQSHEHVPDLHSWYQITLDKEADLEVALTELNAMAEVDQAYEAPQPAPPPGFPSESTPSFTSMQHSYFGSAPAGIEAVWARSQPGGRGIGVVVIDLEYDWHFQHEDLLLSPTILISGQRWSGYGRDHGTAVLGILVGRDNTFGITGGVPDATVRVVGAMDGGQYRPANAVANAAAVMVPGDVLLIEQQTTYGGVSGHYLPLEWIGSVYDAVRLATAAGRVVVAAAGNGNNNLDSPLYGGKFDRSIYDSRAIIVGAGNANNARLSFSNYGARVDVHARGTGVTTTGYGDLYGSSENDYYTSTFNGTSSASAIVAVAAVAAQGYQKHSGRPVLSPLALRSLLASTGSEQTGDTSQKIGPQPDLKKAFAQLDAPPPPPLVASIVGSDHIPANMWCDWLGTANGGTPPYISLGFVAVGSISNESQSGFHYSAIGTFGEIEIHFGVRDSEGQTAQAVKRVRVGGAGADC